MGAQPLSDRSVRRIARTTGLDVLFANAHGGYVHSFVTRDHRHGLWHRYDHTWEFDDDDPTHTTRCVRFFPDDFPSEHR